MKLCLHGVVILSIALPMSFGDVGCPTGAKYSSPGRCADYFECVGGQLKKKSCGDTEWFDEPSGECRLKTSVTSCPQPCTGTDTWPGSQEDCTLYIGCENGKPVTKACPNGQFYNRILRECRLGDELSCFESCFWSRPRDTLPDNCTDYLECVNYTIRKKSCPPGQAFHEADLECRPRQEANCHREDPECEEGEKRPNPYNCYGYEICERGKLRKKYCPGGRMFDRSLTKCVHQPPEYNCSSEGSCSWEGRKRSLGNSVEEYEICEGGKKIKMTCPGGMGFDENLESCEIIPTCRSQETRALRNETTNCSHEYQECIKGVFRTKRCLLGQFFDRTTKTCVSRAPEGCLGCSVGDVRPIPGFWREYERCTDGLRWAKESCGMMQQFDAKKNTCVFRLTASPALCLFGQTTPVEGSCTDYRECGLSGEFDTVKSCRDTGKVYDQEGGGCRWRSFGDCRGVEGNSNKNCKDGDTKPSKNGNLAEYQECASGAWKRTPCPLGTLYLYGECKDTGESGPPSWPAPRDGSCPAGSRRPVGGQCRLYDDCIPGGLRIRRRCPVGLRYDTATKLCRPYSLAACQSALCSGFERAPDLNNCSIYYECDSGIFVTLKCPTFHGFDHVKKECAMYPLARCAKKPIL